MLVLTQNCKDKAIGNIKDCIWIVKLQGTPVAAAVDKMYGCAYGKNHNGCGKADFYSGGVLAYKHNKQWQQDNRNRNAKAVGKSIYIKLAGNSHSKRDKQYDIFFGFFFEQ